MSNANTDDSDEEATTVTDDEEATTVTDDEEAATTADGEEAATTTDGEEATTTTNGQEAQKVDQTVEDVADTSSEGRKKNTGNTIILVKIRPRLLQDQEQYKLPIKKVLIL